MDIGGIIIATIIGAPIAWIIARFLNKLFSEGKTKKIVELYEKRLEEKDKSHEALVKEKDKILERAIREKRKKEKESGRILGSIKRSGLSVEKLVQKYDKPLNAILISYAAQKEITDSGYAKGCKFVGNELKRYNARSLGGTDILVPPTKVPNWIKNSDDLKNWFEKEVLKGRYCKLKFLILVDIRNKAYWSTYLPYLQKRPMHLTFGEVLDIEDIFTEKEIRTIALGDIIRDGDIAWLVSRGLSGGELEVVLRNQLFIEKRLGNPSLREIAKKDMVNKLMDILRELGISDPEQVSKSIVNEASFWISKLR